MLSRLEEKPGAPERHRVSTTPAGAAPTLALALGGALLIVVSGAAAPPRAAGSGAGTPPGAPPAARAGPQALPGAPPQTVSVRAPESISLSPGRSTEAVVVVIAAAGFHLQASPASDADLVPLRLDLGSNDGVHVGEIAYPRGRPFRIEGTPRALSTCGGTLQIRVPISLDDATPPGDHVLRGTLHYQACDARRLYAPASVPVSLTIRVL